MSRGGGQSLEDLDGPVFPLGYSERGIGVAKAMRELVLGGVSAPPLAAWLS